MQKISISRDYTQAIGTKDIFFSILASSTIYYLLKRCIYEKIEKGIRVGAFQVSSEQRNSDLFKEKLKSSIWKLCIYSFLAVYGLWYIPWLSWTFIPVTYMVPHKFLPAKVLVHYLVEFTHYSLSLFFLFFEPRKKDFAQMVVHHILTLLLILFSFQKK